MKITAEIVKEHGLSPEEYQHILKILGREPTFVELGIFSVMWSEHCSYKSSRIHFFLNGKTYTPPPFCAPYGGAATGVGGILRDIFTMGARPIALLDSLRF